MIEILHYLKDSKLWELSYIFLMMGNAGLISSTVGMVFRRVLGLRGFGSTAEGPGLGVDV